MAWNLRDHFVDAHAAFVFEDVCREDLRRHLLSRNICAEYGKHWRNEEIDLIALDRRNGEAYVVECKFILKPVGLTTLNSLKNKVSKVRELRDFEVTYCLFSVSGFNDDLKALCAENVLLFNDGENVNRTRT